MNSPRNKYVEVEPQIHWNEILIQKRDAEHPVQPQIYKGDPRICTIFIPAWGSNWGSSGFSHNQNNHDLSGMYVTCIYCGLCVKINMCKMQRDVQRLWAHFFYVCGWQKPKDPQFDSHGWRRHYTGRYTMSGISLVYLCVQPFVMAS